MRRWRIGLVVPVLLVVGWVLLTRFGAVAASHPAYLVVLVVAGVLALTALLTGLRASPPRATRSRGRRVLARTLQVVGVVAVVAVMAYLRPYAATEAAAAATQGQDGVDVEVRATEIVLTPGSGATGVGLLFYPGALVDPRAYVPLLGEVAREGYEVHILKPPLGVALLPSGADRVIADASEVDVWVTAGHSLGGVAASSFAQDHPDDVGGLVLWASYPQGSLASTALAVTSIWGTQDGLTTPADVEASRANLPASTTYLAIEGGVHAFFGDYGPQAGDGKPTADREDAQQRIVEGTLALMADVAN